MNEQGLSSLVPEFYYDLIGRIVPGVVAVLFFKWELFLTEPSATHFFVLITLGYFVGVSLDFAGDLLLRNTLFYPIVKVFGCCMETESVLWPAVHGLEAVLQPGAKKAMAERLQFCSLAMISTAAAFLTPEWFVQVAGPNHKAILLGFAGFWLISYFWLTRINTLRFARSA